MTITTETHRDSINGITAKAQQADAIASLLMSQFEGETRHSDEVCLNALWAITGLMRGILQDSNGLIVNAQVRST